VSGEVNVNKTGFIPGEIMVINASVDNLSNTKIHKTKLNLKRKLSLKSRTKTRSFSDIILTEDYEGIGKRKSLTLNNKPLQLPLDVAPTGLPNCSIIGLEYVLELEGVVKGCHGNLRVPARVFFASYSGLPNIPVVSYIPVAPVGYGEPTAPAIGGAPAVGVYPAGETQQTEPSASLPPSYQEASADANGAAAPPAAGSYYDWNQSAFTYNSSAT